MNNSRKILSLGVHGLTYLGFFVVQLFFNFDIPQNLSGQDLLGSFHEAGPCKVAHATVKTSHQHDHKHHFRLNKRFEPNASVAPEVCLEEAPIIYYHRPKHFSRNEFFIPSDHASRITLRGPPALVYPLA